MDNKIFNIIWALLCFMLTIGVLNRVAIIELQDRQPIIIYSTQQTVQTDIDSDFSELLDMMDAVYGEDS